MLSLLHKQNLWHYLCFEILKTIIDSNTTKGVSGCSSRDQQKPGLGAGHCQPAPSPSLWAEFGCPDTAYTLTANHKEAVKVVLRCCVKSPPTPQSHSPERTPQPSGQRAPLCQVLPFSWAPASEAVCLFCFVEVV